jgi:hypothetical protein
MTYKTALTRRFGKTLRRELFIFSAVAHSTRQSGSLVTCISHRPFVTDHSQT